MTAIIGKNKVQVKDFKISPEYLQGLFDSYLENAVFAGTYAPDEPDLIIVRQALLDMFGEDIEITLDEGEEYPVMESEEGVVY